MTADLPSRRRVRPAIVGGLVAALVLVVGFAFVTADHNRDDPRVFCFADGRIGSDGELYGRDNDQGCLWANSDGDLLVSDSQTIN